MKNDQLISVRERLERLKNNPKPVPKPLDVTNMIPDRDVKPLGEGMLTFEKMFQQKVEKSIKRIDMIKERMKGSEMFMNYFYDLKEAEKEFLDLLEKAEEKHIEFPENFLRKVEIIKNRIRSKIR